MARSFTGKDAKDLIASHESLLNGLRGVINAGEKLEASVKQAAEKALKDAGIGQQVMACIDEGWLDRPRSADTEALSVSLYRLIRAQPAIRQGKALDSAFTRQIEAAIRSLRPGASSLRWLFSSRDARQRAEDAYVILEDLLNGAYKQHVLTCFESIRSGGAVTAGEAESALDGHAEECRQCLIQSGAFPEQLKSMPRLAALLTSRRQAVSEYRQALDTSLQRQEKGKAAVAEAVRRMRSGQLAEALRTYDVDTLTQVRSGVRVKALRDNGYTTIADICSATPWNLASIHGISESSAWSLKEAANQIAAQVEQTCRLSISTDEKAPEASALIRALCAYRRVRETDEAYRSQLESQNAVVEDSLKALQPMQNVLGWLYATDQERSGFIRAFRKLSQPGCGDFAVQVRLFGSAVRSLAVPSAAEAWSEFTRDSIAYFNLLEELVPGALGNGDTLYGLPEDLAREIQDQTYFSQGLKVTLRRYQEWGVKYILHQGNALLGDEMGLGKTIQAIAAMVSLRNTGATHFIVVCPASVLPNWCREVDSKSRLRATKVHGTGREAAFRSWLQTGGVAVTTYETTGIFKCPEGFMADLLVVDEAHYIKNDSAQRSKRVRALAAHARRLLFMTGTALENKVAEMLSLIEVLKPSIAAQARPIAYMSAAPLFRQTVAPVYYRRKREDVLTELPAITESKEWCELLPEEEKQYEDAVLLKEMHAIRKVSWAVGDLSLSSKARRMQEIIEAAEEDGRKVLVFSFYLETIRSISLFLGSRCTQPISGSTPPERRQEIIDSFEKMPAGSVLLAQIQAGGTGLNIQSASVVIICEPQLKPSTETQAISRAYRMGHIILAFLSKEKTRGN